MFATLMSSFAALAIAGTIPALDPTPAEPVTVAPKVDNGSAPVSRNQRFCSNEAFTGTRINRTICKTRAQWEAQGVDIEAPKR